MKTAYIIHGAYGNPKENWIPWLKIELEKRDFKVFVPKFPTPKKQTLNNWLKVFKKYEKFTDENSIFIGHSLGVAFILTLLEKIKIKSAYLVAGFISPLDNPEFDRINKTFINKKFNWRKIRDNCHKFYLFHSDNDPYVPLERAKEIARKLKVRIIIIKNAGHFNKDAGYTKFPDLINKITH
ncbi:MAG: alpha/beta hydrolase [Candidatus Berkelbacteria bacterium]|nr:alpha/beta hydrolase [Candidatus Berkelbacteria bacterium]